MEASRKEVLKFLCDMFIEYNKQKVTYCLLRNYESLPDKLESRDVDILISATDKKKNRSIINALVTRYGLVIYNHYVDERFDQFFLYKRNTLDSFFELKLDFFFNSELYGVQILSGETILNSRVKFNNFYVAADTYKVLDKWLFIYLVGARLPTRYHDHFKVIFVRHRKTLNQLLATLFGSKRANQLCTLICKNGFSEIPQISRWDRLSFLTKRYCNNLLSCF